MRLEDICTVFTDGDWIESKDQSDSGIRLVQTGNIGEGIYLEKEARAKYISEETFDILKCTEVFSGDILVSRLPEPVGRACIVPEKTERMITAVDCTICRPNESLISKEYLCYFMRSNAYYTRLLGNVTGTTRKRISRKNLGNVELRVPAKDEQKAVVEQLDCLVKVIDSRKKELQLLDNLIKARFVEMFGDPVLNPFSWEMKRFDEICENLDSRRKPISSGDRVEGIYPYYGASGIVDYVEDYIFDEDILLVSEDGANLLMRSTPIAFSVSGKVWVNNHAHVVRFDKMSLQKYVEIYFSLIDISDSITGSAQPKLNQAKLNAMMIPIPEDILLDRYCEFLYQVDKSKVVVYLKYYLAHRKRV